MDFEKLGEFYLGKQYDIKTKQVLDRLLMYDARDLTTHAMCVGMTGSGKTGLCIDLLEEAAIDNVPAIIVDPKGDITNLLLTFPQLRSSDFQPWVNIDDARRKDMTVEQYAENQAELWKNGLADWGQDGERIKALRDAADFKIFTPGSEAGIPVSILHSFDAPQADWSVESELLREQIQGTVSALLGLVGIEADPVRSKEHIFLSNIIEFFWRQGENLDIKKLIMAIQNPPVRQIGVFDVDSFYPQKERFELAMQLNNIIASPSFQSWIQGQPLDIASFFATPEGKTRHSIFYIAHLSEPERMFFVTMLLNQLITWMRKQPGTTSLRALFYMDEIFGFFPPIRNPPSKRPMLTILKQGRAFGVGAVLTTQNPVDLDYTGLTNAGTWFIGRLQTERDKERVLDGLASASTQAGKSLNKREMSDLISALGKRVFLMHNVHEAAPVTFQTRWAMSYLRGPLTREQVKTLVKNAAPDSMVNFQTPYAEAEAKTRARQTSLMGTPQSISPEIENLYLPVMKSDSAALLELQTKEDMTIEPADSTVVYKPIVLGTGRVFFVDRYKNVNEQQDFAMKAEIPKVGGRFTWEKADPQVVNPGSLKRLPEHGAMFEPIPMSVNEPSEFKNLKKDLEDYLYRESSVTLLFSPALDIYSNAGESQRDFAMRLTQIARERRDEEVDDLSKKYEKKLMALDDKIQREGLVLDRKKSEASSRKFETTTSVGESILGAFFGRSSYRSASSGMSKYRQSKSAGMRAQEAEQKIQQLGQEKAALEAELKGEVAAITQKWDQALSEFQEIPIKPRRADVDVEVFALGWMPHWQISFTDKEGNPRFGMVPAV